MPRCNWKIERNGSFIGGCGCTLPPDFVEKNEQKDDEYICHFCLKGQNVIEGSDGTVYKKEEVIDDYLKLLERIANSDNIKKAVTNMKVKQAINEIGRK